MNLATGLRAAALPVLAVVLASGVLGVELANGGAHYRPLRPADPCVTRSVTSVSTGIEGLTERLVLIGLDNAACRLGVSREALTVQLAQSGSPTDAQVAALRSGLLAAVDRLNAAGQLPRPSQLTNEAVAASNLNGFLKAAIRAVPDSLIDAAFTTDDLLRRTISDLDLRALLTNLDDADDLNSQVTSAVKKAVTDALVARVRGLL